MDEDIDARRRPRTPWFALFGAAGGAAGLAPWLLTGPFLPLQNLGEDQDPARNGPVVLLPFSQYAIVTIIVLLVVGGVFAGLIARARRSRPGVARSFVALGGLALVQIVAIAQTAAVTRAVLQERDESVLYLVLLTTVAVLAAVTAWVACLLVAAAPRAGAGLGLAVGAAAGGSWIGPFLSPLFSYTSPADVLLAVLPYVAPVLVGLVIVWTGVSSIGRVLTAVAALVLVWLVPALSTALSSAAGTRVLARDLPGMADYGVRVFTSASTIPEIIVPPLLTTVVVAVGGLIIRRVVSGRAPRSAAA